MASDNNSRLILGIDPGLTPGYCVLRGHEVLVSGFFEEPTDFPIAMRMVNLFAAIENIIKTYRPAIGDNLSFIVAIEDISVVRATKGRFNNSNFATSWLYGAVLIYCWRKNIPCYTFPPSQVKKSFTGNGKASKQEICSHAKTKNHNEADAVAIAYTAQKEFNLWIPEQ